LAYVTDNRLHQLVDSFGREVAQAAWDAGQAAILQIEELVRKLNIDCEFAWVPGYLHSPWDQPASTTEDRDALQRDADLAAQLGFAANYADAVPLLNVAGVRFADQALFHPVKYVTGLMRHVVGGGGHVYENSEVEKVDDKGVVHCRGHKVKCEHLVIATHVPLRGRAGEAEAIALQTKLAAYSTYVISARLPKGYASPALYWDTATPYNYLRIQDQEDHLLAVFGGEDHKTGQVKNTAEPYERLERRWQRTFPECRIGKHWSGQVIHTSDGLPLIGELGPKQYIATGFAGNGLTFGTFAAMMIRDAIAQIANPWRDLFRPDRAVFRHGLWNYLKESVDYPRYYLQDRLVPAEVGSVDEVPIGTGRIVRLNGERVAVYLDAHNHVSYHSAVCSHMGCIVRWNAAERTWDCPCHGSRFTPTGRVIAGPAESPLPEPTTAASPH
jgi:glycine/D-amino acid oxidase-like deaminating enzyme/nitrite reductase/ring-hydroxylating ferredoxin subunit